MENSQALSELPRSLVSWEEGPYDAVHSITTVQTLPTAHSFLVTHGLNDSIDLRDKRESHRVSEMKSAPMGSETREQLTIRS